VRDVDVGIMQLHAALDARHELIRGELNAAHRLKFDIMARHRAHLQIYRDCLKASADKGQWVLQLPNMDVYSVVMAVDVANTLRTLAQQCPSLLPPVDTTLHVTWDPTAVLKQVATHGEIVKAAVSLEHCLVEWTESKSTTPEHGYDLGHCHTSVVAIPTTVTVRLCNAHGQCVAPPGLPLVVTLHDRQGAKAALHNLVTIKEHEDRGGVFACTFVVPEPGGFELHVSLFHQPLPGSPFAIVGRHSWPVSVDGEGCTRCTSGMEASFVISLTLPLTGSQSPVTPTAWPMPFAASSIAVLLHNDDPALNIHVPVRVVAETVDSVRVWFTGPAVGTHRLSISVDGELLKGSPFTVVAVAKVLQLAPTNALPASNAVGRSRSRPHGPSPTSLNNKFKPTPTLAAVPAVAFAAETLMVAELLAAEPHHIIQADTAVDASASAAASGTRADQSVVPPLALPPSPSLPPPTPQMLVPKRVQVTSRFAVGVRHEKYAGYRMLTGVEWENAATGVDLAAQHAAERGLPLLCVPLNCCGTLFVADGCCQVKGKSLVEWGHTGRQQLRNNYIITPRSNKGSSQGVSWLDTTPDVASWPMDVTVLAGSMSAGQPCIFIKK
jgi:hypothetical protein